MLVIGGVIYNTIQHSSTFVRDDTCSVFAGSQHVFLGSIMSETCDQACQ